MTARVDGNRSGDALDWNFENLGSEFFRGAKTPVANLASVIVGGAYEALRKFEIERMASRRSYFWAAAAITGGRGR